MGIGDDFTLNSFKFCLDHGNEVCWTHCFCDHREDNNATISDLARTLGKGEKYDERKQICAFALGAKPAKKGSTAWKCRSHGKVDCKNCFDWTKIIMNQEQ
ncbi:hypothetical protein BDZ89DRAFT_1012040 [Hymenopellis radicata]|nr:hypothetical protein BDZ89DRAFT_1012040 [Hymenopellis radicata]